ncbi:MAG: hypothetical protein WC798_02660 [Candidatus Paceibacterota bacterium]|jgi:hypothetical protein
METRKRKKFAKWGLIAIGAMFAVIIFLALGSMARADARKEVSLPMCGEAALS